MNYAEEKTRIENEIKALQEHLENLKKQEIQEAWKNTLVDRFAKFLEKVDFSKIDEINVNATTEKAEEPIPPFYQAHFRLSDFITAKELIEEHNENAEPVKVETEPTAEPTAEPEKPENKFKVGDYVYYQNCGVYGEIIEIKDGIISIKEKDDNIYKVRPEWIYKIERPAEKPNETPEEKPVKMKMSLDELIKGME